ncbi:MAG: T9SS type A sorting domain-containing protein [Muribaculaceae bacterium]|nr:T9SS type A sorting domain-containing protein [Muribaculaceae bacterium]
MKHFTLSIAALAILSVPATAQDMPANPGAIEHTFANWKDQKVTYDVMIINDDARTRLESMENVTVNKLEHWLNAGGDLGRGAWNGVADDAWLQTEGCDGGIIKDMGAQAFFCIYEHWWNYWAGAWADQETAVDLSHINNSTHMHMAVKIPSTAVPLALNFKFFRLSDTEEKEQANGDDLKCIRFSLAKEGDHSKASFPVIGELKSGEWTAIDMTLGELDELLKEQNSENTIDYNRFTSAWTGRVCHISVPSDPSSQPQKDAVFGIDGVYLYTPADLAGIDNITGDSDMEIIISSGCVSVIGGEGIEIYGIDGRKVAASATSVVGIDNLAKGVYIVKAGGKTKKFVVGR